MSRDSRPIWDTYADADMTARCPNCRAGPHTWCSRPDGRVRRVPCIARVRHAEQLTQPT